MRPRFLCALMACLLTVGPAGFLPAQQTQAIRVANYAVAYDVDSATATYCRVEGAQGAIWDPAPIPVGPKVKTTGSSASLTAVTASTGPFALVSVGDLVVSSNGNLSSPDVRVVIARADADNVTLSSAVDWSTDAQSGTGRTFGFYKTRCGTTSADGWVDVSGSTKKTFYVALEQGDLDSLDWKIECRISNLDQHAVPVYPGTATTCGSDGTSTASGGYCHFLNAIKGTDAARFFITDDNVFTSCRIALKYGSTDTADTTTNLERVTAAVSAVRQ